VSRPWPRWLFLQFANTRLGCTPATVSSNTSPYVSLLQRFQLHAHAKFFDFLNQYHLSTDLVIQLPNMMLKVRYEVLKAVKSGRNHCMTAMCQPTTPRSTRC
jgi:hypothetical protein